jgi:hypothetical protein
MVKLDNEALNVPVVPEGVTATVEFALVGLDTVVE